MPAKVSFTPNANGWFNTKMSMTDPRDAQVAYFRSKSGLSDTATLKYHIEDHMMATLTSLGYTTGALNDRLIAFFRAKTGLPTRNVNDLSNAFFSSNSNDFS